MRLASSVRSLADRLSAGVPVTVGGAAPAAPPPSVDPATAALDVLVKTGEVTVRSPDGEVEYLLRDPGLVHGPQPSLVVYYRAHRWPVQAWVPLNPGWGFHPSIFLDKRKPRALSRAEAIEVTGLSILAAIFAGIRVYALQCGHQLDEPLFSSTPTRKTGGMT